MYKMLLVEDEPWIAKGLAKTIHETNENFELIGIVHNGIDALRIAEEQHPDVIMTDIVMPGMDGIQFIREVRKRGISSLFIILTGYAEFHYAREALSLGVFEYVLKPLDRGIMEGVLQKVERILDKECGQMDFEKSIEIMNLLVSPGTADNRRTDTIQTLLQFRKRNDYFAAVLLYSDHKVKIDFPAADYEVSQLSYGLKKHLYFVSFTDRDAFVRQMNGLAQRSGISAGISSFYREITKIRMAWRESQLALYNTVLKNETGVFFYKPNKNLTVINQIQDIVRKNRDIVEKDIGPFLERLQLLLRADDVCAEELEPIYNIILKKVVDIYPGLTAECFIPSFDALINNLDDIGEVFNTIKDTIEYAQANNPHPFAPNHSVKEIVNYLEAHIEQNPSLGDLANKFYMNTSYLSQLFRKETGRTFSDIKNEMRMELAKQYLRNTRLPIDMICEKSGCTDYFHFNKLFKKYTGSTPTQYRGRIH